MQYILCLYETDIQVLNTGECQISDKIMKIGPNQVHMAPFGLIFDRVESYRVWEASGIPPGAQNRQKIKKTFFLLVFPYFPLFSPIPPSWHCTLHSVCPRVSAAGQPLKAIYTGWRPKTEGRQCTLKNGRCPLSWGRPVHPDLWSSKLQPAYTAP